jgi:dienelactone hydrolase
MERSKLLVLWAMSALYALGTALARADDPLMRLELHPFASTTLSDQNLLTGHRERGQEVTLVGELSIPMEAEGRLPVVVLLHGSAGVLPYVTEWRAQFAQMGVATFIVDSFTPRHISSTIADQDQLGRLNGVLDAYGALALLRTHPRVDPQRIVLVGFSRGGDAALYAALRRLHDFYASPDSRFAAHVAFYPNCGTTYRNDTDLEPVPVRVFHGTADDYAPLVPCRAYVERLTKAHLDVRLKEYDGAMHVFMWKALTEPAQLKQGQTTRACELAERPDGTVVNVRTGSPFTYKDPCVELGPHVAYDAAAAADASNELKALVATIARR